MTRIISGSAGGRRLEVPRSGTRPTSDRVREALFSSLDTECAPWSQVRVLDLYAGSGALALEALSRGAQSVVMVDQAAEAVAAMRRNTQVVEGPNPDQARVDIVRSDVGRHLRGSPSGEPFHLALLDPPYTVDHSVVEAEVEMLADNAWLHPEAVVVVERSGRDAFTWPPGFVEIRQRKYGDTALWLGRWSQD